MQTRSLAIVAASITLTMCCGAGAALTLFVRGRAAPTSGLARTYACPEPVASMDAPSIEARLDELGAWASVAVVDERHVRVLLGADESSASLASSVVASRVLELMPVDEGAMRTLVAGALPPGVTSEGGYGDFLVTLTAPDAATLHQVDPLVPPGDQLVAQCGAPEPGCRGYVTRPSALGNDDVARADASTDDALQLASVGLTLTAQGAQRFEALTTQIAGGRLAIVVDGDAVSVPVVRGRIGGGRVMITLGGDSSLGDAQALAAALGAGRLSCSAWTLEREELVRE